MLFNNGSHPFLTGKENKQKSFAKLKSPYGYLKQKN